MKPKMIILTGLAATLLTSPVLFGQETTTTTTVTTTTNTGGTIGNNEPFSKGTNVLGLSIGVGGYYSYWGYGYSETPNFVLTYENATFGNVGPGVISLGALLSYKGIGDNWVAGGYSYSEKWNYWIVGLRSAFHWNFTNSPKFDPYIGLMLGYYYINYTFSTDNPDYFHPGNPGYVYYASSYPNYYALSLYLGARYYVSNKVGIWGELGYGYSTLALGVNFKL